MFRCCQTIKTYICSFELYISFYILIHLEHERRMLLSGLSHSTQSLANMMPPMVSEFIDEDENDTAPTENRE